MPGRALSRHLSGGADFIPTSQSAHWSPSPAQTDRFREVAEDEFVLIEDRDLERARSARPPPGAVELVEPLRREGLSPVPVTRHEPD